MFQVGKYWNRNERKAHLEQAREQKRKRQIAVLNAKLKAAAGSDSQSSCSLSPNATTQLKKQLSSPSSSGNAVPSVNNNCDKAVTSPSRQSMNVDEPDQIVRSRSMEPVVLSVTTV